MAELKADYFCPGTKPTNVLAPQWQDLLTQTDVGALLWVRRMISRFTAGMASLKAQGKSIHTRSGLVALNYYVWVVLIKLTRIVLCKNSSLN